MERTELSAYSPIVFYLAATAGIVLLFYNPRWLFFTVLAGLVTIDAKAYYFTRLGGSAFFNFFDMHILLGLLAALFIKRDTSRSLPFLFALVVADIFLGTAVTYSWLGYNYDAIRSIRQVLDFPLLWYIAYRCVNTRADARLFLQIVLWGCFIQSVRQCFYVAESARLSSNEFAWRTIRYYNAGIVLPPLCCLLMPGNNFLRSKAFLYVSAGISAVALVLIQTRSLWIPQAIVILVGGMILARRKLPRIMFYCVPGIVVSAMAMSIFAPKVDVLRVFTTGHSTDFSSGTGRENVLFVEVFEWLKGDVIFGRGLGFFNSSELAAKYPNAEWWGHIGYISYLSNFGLVGLYLFGIAYPKQALSKARVLWRSADPELRLFGLITGSLVWTAVLESFLTGGLMFAGWYSLVIMMIGAAFSLAQESAALESERGAMEWTAGSHAH